MDGMEDPRDKFHMRPGDQFQLDDTVVIVSGDLKGHRGWVRTYDGWDKLAKGYVYVAFSSGSGVLFQPDALEHAEVYDFHASRNEVEAIYG